MAKYWIIEGTDHEGNRIVVRSDREDTADHIRKLFTSENYLDILVFVKDDNA